MPPSPIAADVLGSTDDSLFLYGLDQASADQQPRGDRLRECPAEAGGDSCLFTAVDAPRALPLPGTLAQPALLRLPPLPVLALAGANAAERLVGA